MSAPTPDELVRLDAHFIHPFSFFGQPWPPVIWERGRGALIWDRDGKEYIDGTCGLWQCAVGHGREEMVATASEQMGKLEAYTTLGPYANEPAIRLAARLAELAPSSLNRVVLTQGGSEGVEVAIKLARRYWHAQGQPQRDVILARRGSFHGVTYGALAASGNEFLSAGFGPPAPGYAHLAELGQQTTEELIAELEATINAVGPERIAAFIAEPVLGAAGVLTFPEGYWPAVEQVLRAYGILFALDEVITAFGRLGHWFAADLYRLTPDLIVVAKSLTSGYFPLGAVLVADDVHAGLEGVPFPHVVTGTGHPVGCALALTNLRLIEEEGLLAHAARLGQRMLGQLQTALDLPGVTGLRGLGLMLALDLREPLDPNTVMQRLHEQGVIIRSAPSSLILSPPLVVEEGQADRVIELLLAALTELSSTGD